MIYETLLNEIINCKIIPGTKITEEELVNRFCLSRTPVRGAIIQLVKDGLLEVKPKKGTFVTKIDTKDISNALAIRIAIEEKVYYEIVGNINNEKISLLNEILKNQEEIIKLDESIDKSRKLYENDNEFHKTLFEIANKKEVWEYANNLLIPLNRFRIMSNLRRDDDLKIILNYHKELLNSLINNDVKKAISLFEEHLNVGFEGMDNVKKKYPNYFK